MTRSNQELRVHAQHSLRAPDAEVFTSRAKPALLPEWMDGDCSYEDFRDCVRDIAAATRFTRAYAPTLQFVAEACARNRDRTPVRILDVGSGGGDVLRRVADWAHARHSAVELTGIDLNPFGTRAAEELSARDPRYRDIRWLTGDVFFEGSVQTPDLVVSSLVTHHMEDDEIVRFLRWMESHAHRGWFISDLVRSARSYRWFRILSHAMRWHPFVRHDGLVSIRRSFQEPDWSRLLAAAEIDAAHVRLQRCAIGRLCLTRLR